MTSPEIKESVLGVLHGIAPEVDPASIAPEANLRDQLDLDSIDYLHFVLGLAEALGVAIPEADYTQVATLDGCIAYLGAHGATRRAQ
jgi:acyl carrier protein